MPHIHELYDFVVSFFIVHDGKVLLVNHPRYQKWISPGGHIELHEDPEEALYREIQEETGLPVEILASKPTIPTAKVKFIPTPRYIDVHEANPPHKHIALVYFARAKTDNFILSDEHTDMKWFTPSDLNDPAYAISPEDQFYAREALGAANL